MTKKNAIYLIIGLVIISLFIIFSGLIFIRHHRSPFGLPGFLSTPYRHFHSQGQPLTITDVNLIRDWMIFGYLNKVFNLPSDYLKTKLNITNPRYPNVTIKKIAAEQKISSTVYLETIKEAIIQYLASKK